MIEPKTNVTELSKNSKRELKIFLQVTESFALFSTCRSLRWSLRLSCSSWPPTTTASLRTATSESGSQAWRNLARQRGQSVHLYCVWSQTLFYFSCTPDILFLQLQSVLRDRASVGVGQQHVESQEEWRNHETLERVSDSIGQTWDRERQTFYYTDAV